MARSLSITRRRVGLVDLSLQARPNVAAYQFYAAANFDAAFTQFALVPAGGLRSPSLNTDIQFVVGQFRGLTRFLFDPNDYTTAVPAVNDANPFFVQIKQVSTAGVVGPAEAMHLILPYNPSPNRSFVLNGSAPSEASLANSLEIQLPMLCNDWEFQVNGAADLFVAFEPSGPEFTVNPLSSDFTNYRHVYTKVSQVFIRGNGAPTAINAIFTEYNNPTI
jgi:hypothetical protein